MSHAPVEPGQVLSNRFRVERVLGVGGMGVVVEATHLQLQQRIALKFLLPHMVANEEAVHRFLREARAAAEIRSEHVVRVSDVGTLDDGAPYMVMEYLEGIDLGQHLRAEGKIPPVEAAELMLQALEAIAEAHAAHIIHRDLKPGNIFLSRRRDGSSLVKVLDFGISKPLDEDSLELTRTSAIMGSPLYMSPEQLRASRDADQRSDIWSVGVILYELVYGDTPFSGESLGGLALAIGAEPHKPLVEVCPDVPQAYSDAIEKCLAKKPADRFQSVAELALSLREVANSRSALISVERISSVLGADAPPSFRPPTASGAEPALGQTNAGWGQTQGGHDKRPTWMMGAAAALVIGASGIGATLYAFSGGDAEAVTAAPVVSAAPEAPEQPTDSAEPEAPGEEPRAEAEVEPEPVVEPEPSAEAEPSAEEQDEPEDPSAAPPPIPPPTPAAPAPVFHRPRAVARPAPAPQPKPKPKPRSFSAWTRE